MFAKLVVALCGFLVWWFGLAENKGKLVGSFLVIVLCFPAVLACVVVALVEFCGFSPHSRPQPALRAG